ncbi:MAG: crossover junction endodeoxyribonuclease RuvC [Ectothiorhodospiraceae bacterium AqS1]|nr:crossover junction endodeoxyribonuclease RuvC [Ectothiorhodospiraceae bacterium AqS1]|eukprot:XP_019861747.1 PREDICTED: uncharacterized protein LOC109590266 [Amphimedon queenslandica]
MRIIGIDPGSRSTGYGILDSEGPKLHHVASGFVQCGAGDWPDRLLTIFDALGELIRIHAPQEFAIEKVFVHRNVASALKLGQARGVAILAGATHSLGVHEYSPNEIKQAVSGRGHASKQQIQHMIRMLLSLPEPLQADRADALATAICHAHRRTSFAMRARLAIACEKEKGGEASQGEEGRDSEPSKAPPSSYRRRANHRSRKARAIEVNE